MELLLNLVWVAMAVGLFVTFWRRQRSRVSTGLRRMALACVLLLLFPIISASDDLHPAQALTEEATRRVSHLTPPVHFSPGNSMPAILPALLFGLLFALTSLQPATGYRSRLGVLEGYRLSRDGRGPPFSRS